MAYSFADARAPSRRTTQYFERIGNRAIYHDGWVACTTPPVPPWDPAAAEVGEDTGTPVTTSYDVYFGLQGRSIAL